jgi:anti-sigma factor ChrR (cupin superfamily)
MNLSDLHEKHDPLEWASLYTLGELSPDDKGSFEQHLHRGCPECQSELQAFGNVIADLAEEVSVAPPPALRERLLKLVAENYTASEPARKGVLLRRAGLLIMRSDELPWEGAPIPGILSKALFVDKKRNYATSLVRVEPKAVYPSHRHNDIEEVFLLEGDFLIEGVRMVPGDFCRSEPGSVHGPSTTESGALLLVFASQHDEMLV